MKPFADMCFALGGALSAGILFAAHHPVYAILCLIATAWFYKKLDDSVNK